MDIKEYLAKESKGNHHPWEMARAKVVFDIIKKHLPAREKTICDVGCGDIFFIQQLSEKLPADTFVGIDTAFDKSIIEKLKALLPDKKVLFFQDIKEAGALNADVVFLMDVIEHIENDSEFINELLNSGIVKNDTLLMITVPAFQRLYANHDTWLGHYRRYTLRELKQRFNSSQVEILNEGYFFKSLVIPRAMQRLMEKQNHQEFNKGTDVSNWNGGKATSFIYKNILWLDYLIFNKILRLKRMGGLSCYLFLRIKK